MFILHLSDFTFSKTKKDHCAYLCESAYLFVYVCVYGYMFAY